jgi:hypothetical protein
MRDYRVVSVKLDGRPVSEILIEDLMTRALSIKVAVITDRPYVLSSVVRKRWLKKLRQLYIQRARLLAGGEANRLSALIEALKNVQFSTNVSQGCQEANITFAAVEDLMHSRLEYQLVFITYELSTNNLERLIVRTLQNSSIFIYEK